MNYLLGDCENLSLIYARHRVAELIGDFSKLRNLSAFVQFENELNACIQALRGDEING